MTVSHVIAQLKEYTGVTFLVRKVKAMHCKLSIDSDSRLFIWHLKIITKQEFNYGYKIYEGLPGDLLTSFF